MEKLIITVATTGAMTTREEHTPYLAISPEEIAEEVYLAYQAGAAVAHIHVRTDEGKATMDMEKFRQTVGLVREKCDIIINMTSSGGLGFSDEERIAPHVELKPDMGTFDAGSMNFYKGVFLNSPSFLEKLGKAYIDNGIKPEVEVFDTGMIWNAKRLMKDGFLKAPIHFQCCLHVHGGMDGSPKNLLRLVEDLPEGSTWSAFGCGPTALAISTMAIHMGGHVRVGMEDNVYLTKGVLAKHNYEFVERIQRLAKEFERPVATVAEARAILGLPPKK